MQPPRESVLPLDAKVESHRTTYLHVTSGNLVRPTESAEDDARHLVRNCIEPLQASKRRFPPKLFILWITPSFFSRRNELLEAIEKELRKHARVPLIGASVAACVFADDASAPSRQVHEEGASRHFQVHEEGASLICLASRFLSARVAVVQDAQSGSEAPEAKAHELVKALQISPSRDFTLRNSRFLLTFLPGYDTGADPAKYCAAEIVSAISEHTHGALHIFGGVASAGRNLQPGYQIVNERAYQRAIVGALISTDLAYGLGLCQGLKQREGSGTYRVKDVDETGRRIRSIWDSQENPVELFEEEIEKPWIFGDERTVLLPCPIDNVLHVQRTVAQNSMLKPLSPDVKEMRGQLDELKGYLRSTFGSTDALFTGGLGISCASRLRYQKEIGWNQRESMDFLDRRYPATNYVGCFMDGEIGINKLGRPVLSNWSLSEALFIDDVTGPAQLHRVVDLLAQPRRVPDTVEKSMGEVLRLIRKAGYPGGMISLLLHDDGSDWIVAHEASGRLWRKKVLPLTQRALDAMDPMDILACVIRQEQSEYIYDAKKDLRCNQKSRKAGRVLSFYALPLRDDNNRPMGTLQIDLGDVRHLSVLDSDKKASLEALGQFASDTITRAMQHEEIALSRALDDIVNRYRDSWKDVIEVTDSFVKAVANVLKIEAHARLYFPAKDVLQLVSGVGDYYQKALQVRPEIKVNSAKKDTPSIRTFKTGKPLIKNDTEIITADDLFESVNGDPLIGEIHKQMKACVIMPIGHENQEPLGIISFHHSKKKWFFTEARLRLMRKVCQRLWMSISNLRQRQFMSDVKPAVGARVNLFTALRQQAEKARSAADATTFSCYLWSEERQLFVLRAQANWFQPGWEDAASFNKDEGLTGQLAMTTKPEHIPDLAKYLTENSRHDKYLECMFRDGLDKGDAFEMLAIPLNFKFRRLGIVTFHRRRRFKSDQQSGFPITSDAVLREVAEDLSATIYALQQQDFTRWHDREMTRLSEVTKILTRNEHRSRNELMEAFCREVINQYHFRQCAVHMVNKARTGFEESFIARRTSSSSRQLTSAGAASTFDIVQHDMADSHALDEYVVRALYEPEVEIPCPPREDDTPQLRAKYAGLIDGVCLPLLDENANGADNVIGVLSLRWARRREDDDKGTIVSSPSWHGLPDLNELAIRFAEALELNKAENKAKFASMVLQGTGAYLVQHQHTLSTAAVTTKGIILEMMRMMKQRGDGPASGELDTFLVNLREKVTQFNDVMDVARTCLRSVPVQQEIDNGLESPEMRVDLKALIEKVLDGLQVQYRPTTDLRRMPFGESANSCESDRGPNIIVIETDLLNIETNGLSSLLHEVFRNPINNSIRELTRPKISDQITSETKQKLIRIRMTTTRSRQCEIEITDTGAGFSSDAWEHVERNEKVTKSAWKGSGLGLFIARLFCELHLGNVRVWPPDGAGARITISLPITEAVSDERSKANNPRG